VAEFIHESIVGLFSIFVVRVRCRRKESSRSLSHLLMSFLFLRKQRPERARSTAEARSRMRLKKDASLAQLFGATVVAVHGTQRNSERVTSALSSSQLCPTTPCARLRLCIGL